MIAILCHRFKNSSPFNILEEMETSIICKPSVQIYYPLLLCFNQHLLPIAYVML
uniref:Uncharacterized protein n=1 Tax=Manihot esculenta TaxID=3983 RepID=A0A2C9USR7_MANES